MKDNKTESITIRTTKDLKEGLQMMADQESRSLSNMIEVILEKAVEAPKKKA